MQQILLWLLENPQCTAKETAAHFGVSTVWLRYVMNSGAFKAKLAELQGDMEIVCVQSTRARLEVLAEIAVEKLQEAVVNSQSPDFILEAADRTLHRLGYAPQKSMVPQVSVQTNFVVSREALAAARVQIVDSSLEAPDPSNRGECLTLTPAALPPVDEVGERPPQPLEPPEPPLPQQQQLQLHFARRS